MKPLYKFLTAFLLCVCFSVFAQENQPAPIEPTRHPLPFQTPGQTQTAPEQIQTTPAQPAARQTEPTQPAAPAQAPETQRRPGSDALQNYRLARSLEDRNRFDEANSYYNEAVRICMEDLNRNGSNMDAYTILTWSLLRQRRYAEVINWGDRALRINPNDFRIIETMGTAYFYLNNYEHSLLMLQRYTASMPRGDRASVAYFFMGEIYRNQRKYHHADIAYTTAVTLEGSIFIWWYRLGTVREAAGEYVSAIEAYERSLSLNPSYRETTEALDRTRRLLASAPR